MLPCVCVISIGFAGPSMSTKDKASAVIPPPPTNTTTHQHPCHPPAPLPGRDFNRQLILSGRAFKNLLIDPFLCGHEQKTDLESKQYFNRVVIL